MEVVIRAEDKHFVATNADDNDRNRVRVTILNHNKLSPIKAISIDAFAHRATGKAIIELSFISESKENLCRLLAKNGIQLSERPPGGNALHDAILKMRKGKAYTVAIDSPKILAALSSLRQLDDDGASKNKDGISDRAYGYAKDIVKRLTPELLKSPANFQKFEFDTIVDPAPKPPMRFW